MRVNKDELKALKVLIDALNDPDLLNEWLAVFNGNKDDDHPILSFLSLYTYEPCNWKLTQKVLSQFKKERDAFIESITNKLNLNPDENILHLFESIQIDVFYSPMEMSRLKALDNYLNCKNIEAYNILKTELENNSEDLYIRSQKTLKNKLLYLPQIFLFGVTFSIVGILVLVNVIGAVLIPFMLINPAIIFLSLGLATVSLIAAFILVLPASSLVSGIYDKIIYPTSIVKIVDQDSYKNVPIEFKNGKTNYTSFFKEPKAFSYLREIQASDENQRSDSHMDFPSTFPVDEKLFGKTLLPV